jgi:hypothetical protein
VTAGQRVEGFALCRAEPRCVVHVWTAVRERRTSHLDKGER